MKFRGLRPDEIEVRVGTVKAKGANMLLYKDARCDMNILDETVGAENWQRDHKEIKDNMYAGIGIYNDEIGQWVWKWDCGTESNTEKEKGEASDSFKRAGFNWGIGRELYTGGQIFIPCPTEIIDEKAQYKKFKLKNQFEFYGISVTSVTYKETEHKREIASLVICDGNGKPIFTKEIDSQSDMPPEERIDSNKKIGTTHMQYITEHIKALDRDLSEYLTFIDVSDMREITIDRFTNELKPQIEKWEKSKKK